MTSRAKALADFLDQLAPRSLAANWDNVGFLVGDDSTIIQKVMTCLTLTPEVAEEAISGGAQMIVSHHPVLFRGAKRLTAQTAEDRVILRIIQNGICLYSPHTAFDNARSGINALIARQLGLVDVHGLRPYAGPVVQDGSGEIGEGRIGKLTSPASLDEFAQTVAQIFKSSEFIVSGPRDRQLRKAAVVCGAGGEFVRDALRQGADVFVTGEIRYHECLAAKYNGMSVCAVGHFASERIGVHHLAQQLKSAFAEVSVWAAKTEEDPFRFWRGGQHA